METANKVHAQGQLTKSSNQGTQRIEFANSLRGLACLCVIFAHYAGVFWESPDAVSALTGMPPYQVSANQLPLANWLDNAIPLLQWGPFGVAIFFLVSGFVIPYSLYRYSATQFLQNRVVRIGPTYVCGFAFTLGMITLGTWSYGANPPFSVADVLIHMLPGIRDIVGSKNIDGIIWTLEIEVKFYLICAIISPLIRRSSPLLFVAPLLIAVTALLLSAYVSAPSGSATRLATVYINSSQYLVFMFIGVVFHMLYEGEMDAKQAMAWTSTLGLLVCLIWSTGPYKATFTIAWSYAIAVCVFAWAMNTPGLLRSNWLLDSIAAISYPLYVVHGVAGYVLMRWMFEMGAPAYASILLTVCTSVFVAYILHVSVEKPCQAYTRNKLGLARKQLEGEVEGRMAA